MSQDSTRTYTFRAWFDGDDEDDTVTVEASTQREAAEKVLERLVEWPEHWNAIGEIDVIGRTAEFNNPHTEEALMLFLVFEVRS